MKKLLAPLTLALAIIPNVAHSAPARVGGGLHGMALNLAVGSILEGIGWVMDEGTRTEKIPADPASGSGSTTGTGGNTATGGTTSAGGATGTGSTPSDAQTYPFEYWFDGKPFSSAESACAYYFGSYLSQQGYKKTRRPDGTYLERTNIYIGSSGYYDSSVPGYFSCTTHASHVSDTSCGNHNFCGSTHSKSGMIAYKGTEKTTTTTVSDDYKEIREKARQAVEQAIINAQAQVNAGTTTAPSDTTDNPPRTGTTTGTGIGDLANPVHVDTNTTTNTGDTTTTNTNTKTENKIFELPTFCGWAGTVCDFMDWVKNDSDIPKDNTEIDIPEQTIQPVDTNIKFNGRCPNDIVYDVSFAGKEFTFFNFQWSEFCEFLSYLKYVIVGMAGLGAIKIVGGVNVND